MRHIAPSNNTERDMDKQMTMNLHTPLYDVHVKLKAKMGSFAGYDMPLYYSDGVMGEHLWTREHAGLFDVSHMGQIFFKGAGTQEFLERITPSSFGALPDGRAKYTVLTNESGTIIDDLIITKLAHDHFFAVVNAGRKDVDIAWFEKHLPLDVEMEIVADRGLLALQGPQAQAVLKDVLKIDLEGMPYMWFIKTKMTDGTEIYISRLGYTGEDGFEISVPESMTPAIWTQLLSHGAVRPVGLAARDSLRLEMGYPLYGHDIDETTTPVEAGLSWVIAKNKDNYFGAEVIKQQLEEGVARKRVGLIIEDKGIVREGTEIQHDSVNVGKITSGSHAPSLNKAIAMGYVQSSLAEKGTFVECVVRGRALKAQIVEMPFYPARTKSMKAQ
jgi:aminomethyltransferase